jgi:hypothetical protein
MKRFFVVSYQCCYHRNTLYMMIHLALSAHCFVMLTVVLLLFCSLFANTFSQFVPLRFDQAINRISQFRNFPPPNLIEDERYNFTLEQILKDMSFSISNNKTSVCDQDFGILLEAASRRDMWAIKILDAWGKPLPSGVLKGNVYWVGDYDECLNPMYLTNNKTFLSQPFDTHYCE